MITVKQITGVVVENSLTIGTNPISRLMDGFYIITKQHYDGVLSG